MAMILVVKTKAYRKVYLVHLRQKCIAEFFKYSRVFNDTGRGKVESTTTTRVSSQVFLLNSQELIHLNNARNKLFIPVI